MHVHCPAQTEGLGSELDVQVTNCDLGHDIRVHVIMVILHILFFSYYLVCSSVYITQNLIKQH